jgi:DNA-binding transcriptional LysR family regulator
VRRPVLFVPNIEFDTLRSFVVVAEKRVFHEAAHALGISPPALTRRIQKLELALGAALLERSTRSVALTAMGRIFLPKAIQITEDLALAVQHVRQESRAQAGHLTLACLPSMTHHLLPLIIRDFRDRYPEIHLRVTECGAAAVLQAVRADDAEFGFTFRAAPDADLAFEPILADPYCLVLPPAHPLTARRAVAWRDLKTQRLITAGNQSGNMRLLDQALRGIDWRPEASYEIDHLTTSLGLVTAGLGIAVLPRSALPPDGSPTVVVRRLVEPEVSRSLGIYRRRGKALPRAGLRLLMTVRRTATGLPSQDAEDTGHSAGEADRPRAGKDRRRDRKFPATGDTAAAAKPLAV